MESSWVEGKKREKSKSSFKVSIYLHPPPPPSLCSATTYATPLNCQTCFIKIMYFGTVYCCFFGCVCVLKRPPKKTMGGGGRRRKICKSSLKHIKISIYLPPPPPTFPPSFSLYILLLLYPPLPPPTILPLPNMFHQKRVVWSSTIHVCACVRVCVLNLKRPLTRSFRPCSSRRPAAEG